MATDEEWGEALEKAARQGKMRAYLVPEVDYQLIETPQPKVAGLYVVYERSSYVDWQRTGLAEPVIMEWNGRQWSYLHIGRGSGAAVYGWIGPLPELRIEEEKR